MGMLTAVWLSVAGGFVLKADGGSHIAVVWAPFGVVGADAFTGHAPRPFFLDISEGWTEFAGLLPGVWGVDIML